MTLHTLLDLQSRLWKYGPIRKTPYVTATTAMKLDFTNYLNQVCERLLGRMKPRFTMRRVNVPIYDGSITCPRELDGIDGIQLVNADNCNLCHPLQIYTRFHEWARPVGSCCSSIVFILSDMVQTFRDPAPGDSGYYLRVKSTEASGNISFIGGYDADWDQVFTTTTLTLVSGTNTTTAIWKSMPQIQKPVTTSFVELYSVDVATAEETLIAVYAPGEKVPAYKRYKVPEWNGAVFARVFGKLAFNDVSANSDIPIPNNLGALKAGMQALAYEDAADMTRADMLWQRALTILDEERADSEDAEQPNFQVDPDFGIGSICQIA